MTTFGRGATGAPAPSPALAVLLSCWDSMAAALAVPGLSEDEADAIRTRGSAVLVLLPVLPLAPTDIGPVLRLLAVAVRHDYVSRAALDALLLRLSGNFHPPPDAAGG